MQEENINQENSSENSNADSGSEKIKNWLQDNLRIIVSVLIVIAIASGVYSYSKRSEEVSSNKTDEAEIMKEEEVTDSEEVSEEQVAKNENTDAQAEESKTAQEDRTSPETVSQETENSFVETASTGEGLTHLSRRALSNYLEKNPDSALTTEHKVYIEDYLRKIVNHKNGVKVGTSVEFSKKTIEEAIASSKKLNESQLNNLKKYSARISSLK